MVVGERDALGFLNVHRISERTKPASAHDDILTADEVDFAAEDGAKSYRFRVGIEHSEQRVKLGMQKKRHTFCACSSCHVPKFDFANCKFQALVGRAY